MLRNMSVKNKVLLTVFAVVLVFFAINLWISLSQLKNTMTKDLKQELTSVGVLTSMNLDKDDIDSLLEVKGANDRTFESVQKQLDQIQKEQGVLSWIYIWKMDGDKVTPVGFTSNLNEIYSPGKQFDDIAPIHLTAAKKALQTGKPEVTDIFADSFGKWRTVFVPLKGNNGEVASVLAVDYSADYINKNIQTSTIKQVLLAVVGLAAVLVIMFITIMKLLKPLKRVVEIADNLANGDLNNADIEIHSNDEMGKISKSIHEMVVRLRHIIINIRDTSNQLASSSEQVTASITDSHLQSEKITNDIQNVAEGASSALEVIQETASAMEESAYGIQKIAESSSVVSESSVITSKEAIQGNEIVQNLVNQMKLVSDSVNHIDEMVNKLNKNSNKISDFVKIITEIAEQTNLLALNAAIEAARAGEHGKGFAVVADEVRKLAEQSATSAGQIAELIQVIQRDSDESLVVMTQGRENVSVGMKYTNDAGEVFKRIVESTEQVADQIQEVSAASEQISASSEEVSASINEVGEGAARSAELARNVHKHQQGQLNSIEEIRDASKLLGETAEELQKLISHFKL